MTIEKIDGVRDGTALGCIGRCKVCGKAVQLCRVFEAFHNGHPHEEDRWLHFGLEVDHEAVLSPGVGAYYDELIAARSEGKT